MSHITRDFDSNYEIGFINGVQFGIYSPEMILKKSVVKIDVEALYDSNGEPRINGLFDPRMGYIEPRSKCKTCEQTYINCPGHFGHIELPKPIFNLQFEDYIVKILRCVCIKCSRILINKEHQAFKNIVANTKGTYKERFEKIYKQCMKVKTCGAIDKKGDNRYDNGGCGAIQPSKYNSTLRKDFTIKAEWKYESGDNPINLTQELNAEIVLAIFKRITEDDALVMGFNTKWCMPSWLIITVLPVVPPSVRPSVRQYNSQRSEDDLTNKYYDIIKYSQMLRNKLAQGVNVSPEVIKQHTDIVQHSVITLFNNEIKDIQPALTRGGRIMKTLRQRLSGKEGRIRNNLMGKRVDFSARSVISPDANLTIEELGVPYVIAMNLTFPEVVNKYNINRLYQLVRNGNRLYPGAKSIKSAKTGKEQFILDDKDTSKFVLEYGDTVNRHLINGDIVLFNRQPSLHKMSMMAHKVRVMEGNTFRLNVDVCKPYNADFDGDEMNNHIPQSLQTAIELKYLASVSKMIISPSENKPIIQPAQDNLLGLFKITDDNVFFTQQEFMNMLVGIEKFNGVMPEPAIKKDKLIKWTGKQLYSIILPPITYRQKSPTPEIKDLIIEEGIMKQGQVEKKASNTILHQIYNDYGHKEATRYLNDLQRLVTRYIIRSGFSVGISDLIVPKEIRKKNEEAILQGKKDIIELTKKVHLNILENIDEGLDVLYGNKIDGITSRTEKAIRDATMKTLTLDNRVNYIVTSGSKGAEINIQQMMCLIGAQTIDGQKNIPKGFTDRTLPHYPRYENSGESRGFITSNFLNGLNPQEFFFHAMAGREGVIDTAVKTANSGYLQRRLVKSMEDLKVGHDFTVRGSNNDIVQFCYGYDGFDSVNLEIQREIDFIKITLEKLHRDYYLDPADKYDYVLAAEIAKMKKLDGWRDIIVSYNKNLEDLITDFHEIYSKFNKIDNTVIYYPVNFKRLILNTVKQFKLANVAKADIHPLEIIKEVNTLIDYTRIKGQRNIGCEVLIWNYLSPKILLRDNKFNRIAFMHVINAIKTRYKYSLAEGGEMVGPLAAQSLGEKTTQMTLHTFHLNMGILRPKS
jgi:DNA-directed RNA polymerase II subunit RPB1